MEQQQDKSKPHTYTKPCCQCKAIRIMRNQCLEKNKEEDCIEFINGFKTCVEAKKLEQQALKQM